MGHAAVLSPAPGVTVHLVVTLRGIRRLGFGEPAIPAGADGPSSLLAEAARQLAEYFSGVRREFDLPLDLEGTEFQQRVWKAVSGIPYGHTRTYAQIAGSIGSPKASRAVGAANGANPVAILVPCHRVVASGGRLGGYGGGLDMKRRLLALETGPGFW